MRLWKVGRNVFPQNRGGEGGRAPFPLSNYRAATLNFIASSRPPSK